MFRESNNLPGGQDVEEPFRDDVAGLVAHQLAAGLVRQENRRADGERADLEDVPQGEQPRPFEDRRSRCSSTPLAQKQVDGWLSYVTNEPNLLKVKGVATHTFLFNDYNAPRVGFRTDLCDKVTCYFSMVGCDLQR